MNADAKFDATLFRRRAGVALAHARLHFDGTADRVDDAAESTIAPSKMRLNAAMMHGGGRIDQVAAERPKLS
jgi:hypothetical protein